MWGFPGLSKAFYEIWLNNLLNKHENNGTDVSFICLFNLCPHNNITEWFSIGSLQSGYLWNLKNLIFFPPIYTDDLLQKLKSNIKLVADDTMLFSVVDCVSSLKSWKALVFYINLNFSFLIRICEPYRYLLYDQSQPAWYAFERS